MSTSTAVADRDGFAHATDAFRRELLAHCYRMLGSIDEAEDAVQETYLRAWRAFRRFEGRSSVRTWLYRIATNVCLTAAADRRRRRVLPSGLGAPSDDPDGPVAPADADVCWVDPIPDALVVDESGDPAAVAVSRETLRLALIASFQHLPPRQRAVLILRDSLGLGAAEVAEILSTSTPAVKSALQRARERIGAVEPDAGELREPADPRAKAALESYVAAFERADPGALASALRDDAVLEMTPSRTWFAGKQTCMPYLRQVLGSPGEWRMIPTRANGQHAVGAYRRDGHANYRSFAIVVLTIAADRITRITLFADDRLFARFGLPVMLRAKPG
jgi:RNA polymerase sigma-70 factor, ECF subfamily